MKCVNCHHSVEDHRVNKSKIATSGKLVCALCDCEMKVEVQQLNREG